MQETIEHIIKSYKMKWKTLLKNAKFLKSIGNHPHMLFLLIASQFQETVDMDLKMLWAKHPSLDWSMHLTVCCYIYPK